MHRDIYELSQEIFLTFESKKDGPLVGTVVAMLAQGSKLLQLNYLFGLFGNYSNFPWRYSKQRFVDKIRMSPKK